MQKSGLLRTISGGAFILALSSLLSRVLGVVRDMLFSHTFGIGGSGGAYALDAYYVAFKIPDLIYSLLIVGALSAAFIPLYTQLRVQQGQEEASRFASEVLRKLLGLLLGLCILLWFGAPWILPLLAPGLGQELQGIAVDLTRIMLLSPLLLGLSSLFQGIENAHKSFWGMALAPLLYNGAILLATWIGALDLGVYALAWGVAGGALLHFLIQIPGILRTPFRYSNTLEEAQTWRKFYRLAIPRMVGMGAQQISALSDALLATLLPLGTLALYTYAFNLQSLPYGVVAIAVSTAVFTDLTEQSEDKKAFMKTLRKSLGTILFWVLPAILGLYFLREPLIRLFLERGAFTSEDTLRTAELLAIFVWAALPQSIIPLFSRAFFALKETWIPVQCALGSMVIALIFNILGLFVFDAGIKTLAMGNFLAGALNAVTLLIFLKKKQNFLFRELIDLKEWLRIAIALTGMVLALNLLKDQNIFFTIPLVATLYLGVDKWLRGLGLKSVNE